MITSFLTHTHTHTHTHTKFLSVAMLLIMLFNSIDTKAQIKVISNGNVGLKLAPGNFNQNPERQVHMRGLLLIDTVRYTNGGQEIGILLRKYNATTNPYCDWGIDLDGNGFEIFRGWPNANNGNFKFFIKESNSYVGINTGNPSYRLDVNGSFRCYGFTNSSDERLKSNIKDISKSLDLVLKLNPKTYDLTIPVNDQSTSQKLLPNGQKYANAEPEILKDQAGFLAQEVKEIMPHLVSEDNAGYLSLNYIGLIPYLIDAIKEQNAKIQDLQSQLQQCCSKNLIQQDKLETERRKLIINEPNTFAALEQNNPNPFNQQTLIGYSIPDNCINSSLHIYDLNGVELKNYSINQKGKGTITVDGNSLKAGMYLYTLICDGKEIATKKMILTSK